MTHPNVFKRTPFALLEIFVLMAQHPEIKGVRADTIRLLRDSRHLIDDEFRHDIRNTSLFIELFKSSQGIHRNLRRMNRYGILGRYLPEFGHIIGQMQHDLFHIYTVDAHTLNLIKHLRKLNRPEMAEKYPLASKIIDRLPKPELIYIAGLYHDIAKGRGGDHSELGAVDAEAFCQSHQLPLWDTQLVSWLVQNHLVMSTTAQRKDLSDPQVIFDFAQLVGDQTHLDYLYVLTVADINATNRRSGTPGAPACSGSSTPRPSAPCAAAWRTRWTARSRSARRRPRPSTNWYATASTRTMPSSYGASSATTTSCATPPATWPGTPRRSSSTRTTARRWC